MTAAEAHAAVPDLEEWLRDMKGFDFAVADFGNRYWRLEVYYGSGDRISKIERQFVDRREGLWSRSWVE